ncbi:hypothetical protein ACFXEL_31710 [Streptomyces sp. NPDC059382]|uniref:hypothetical protein n=1 Tax=Streptomyces sp. NPDC059382 TaxID=3346816 RepID=UPI003678C7A5
MNSMVDTAPPPAQTFAAGRSSGAFRCTHWIVLPDGRQLLVGAEGVADAEAAVCWLVERGHVTASAFEDNWANACGDLLRSRLVAEAFVQQALDVLRAEHRLVLEVAAPDSVIEFVIEPTNFIR